ncbi:MAG TPA: peptidoglycan DD-metalloendopeptidase family protein [Salinivirgaceae bacterium]|nr:peptidoglycan DD-metalloendopeptidase family protein [Salinivirgaceae bacterium]
MKKQWIKYSLLAILITISSVIIIALAKYLVYEWEIKQIEKSTESVEPEPAFEPTYMYGIAVDSMIIIEGKVKKNQTFSDILRKYKVPESTIVSLISKAESIFDLRTIRSGNIFVLLCNSDTTPQYFIYEQDKVNYMLFSLTDSLHIQSQQKEIIRKRKIVSGIIETNLWNSMIENGINPIMSIELSEIYAWSIDFFGLQKNDHFSVIYDEEYVDTISVGIGKIYSALFNHQDKDFFAIQFTQDDKPGYFDEDGQSLQRTFLKAPLRYSRISSRFSYSRKHPILKIRRPHFGVDYAAPAGTPVYSVADGTVVDLRYTTQGGKEIYIKHNSVYTSGYLHLSNYAKGIRKGVRVTQGQHIGYVGNTGLATGPHLDFRMWKNGQPIDPLKVESPPVEPIKKINREEYEKLRDQMMKELREADEELHRKYPELLNKNKKNNLALKIIRED